MEGSSGPRLLLQWKRRCCSPPSAPAFHHAQGLSRHRFSDWFSDLMQWKNTLFFFFCEGMLGFGFFLSDHLACLWLLNLWLWCHKSTCWAWRKRKEEAEQDCFLHWQPAIILAKAEHQTANTHQERKMSYHLTVCLFKSWPESLSIMDFLILFQYDTAILLSEFLLLWPTNFSSDVHIVKSTCRTLN